MPKKIFVSFDFENDRHYKYLLNALSANSKFDLCFDDKSSKEINSWNISTIKSVLSRCINEANITLVIVGKEANKRHKDSALIGYTNWQNFEIAKSKELGNRLIAVKIDYSYESPRELLNCNATWVRSFNAEDIANAIG